MRGAEYREMIANSCRHPNFLELFAASGSMSRSNGEDSVAPWSSEIIVGIFFLGQWELSGFPTTHSIFFFRLSSLKYNDKDGLKIIEKWGKHVFSKSGDVMNKSILTLVATFPLAIVASRMR